MVAMASLKTTILSLLGASTLVQARPLRPSVPAPRELLRIDEQGGFLENLVIRPNGDVLVSRLDAPHIYTVTDSPSTNSSSSAVLASIPDVQHLTGISRVETEDGSESYVIVGGSYDMADLPTFPKGFSKAFVLTFDDEDSASVKQVSDLSPSSQLVNGVTPVPGVPNVVLVAESQGGTIGRLNISTGDFDDEAFSGFFPQLGPLANSSFGIGVNGVKIRDGHVYWTNFDRASVYRLPITGDGYPQSGAEPELVADAGDVAFGLDDFDFEADGNILATTNVDHKVVRVHVDTGATEVVIGGLHDTIVAGSTSVQVAKGRKRAGIVYVTTKESEVDGTVAPGRLLAFETNPKGC